MRQKKAIKVKIFVFIFIAIIIWVLFFSKYSFLKVLKNKIQLEQKSQKITELEEKRRKLEIEKRKLKDQDPDVMEKKARKIGMAKEGEIIIRISDEENKDGE